MSPHPQPHSAVDPRPVNRPTASTQASASTPATLPTPSKAEPETLRKGRERHQRKAKAERKREAVKRVRNYQRWLKAGSPTRSIPEVPSNADFRLANGNGRR